MNRLMLLLFQSSVLLLVVMTAVSFIPVLRSIFVAVLDKSMIYGKYIQYVKRVKETVTTTFLLILQMLLMIFLLLLSLLLLLLPSSFTGGIPLMSGGKLERLPRKIYVRNAHL